MEASGAWPRESQSNMFPTSLQFPTLVSASSAVDAASGAADAASGALAQKKKKKQDQQQQQQTGAQQMGAPAVAAPTPTPTPVATPYGNAVSAFNSGSLLNALALQSNQSPMHSNALSLLGALNMAMYGASLGGGGGQ